MEGVFGWCHFLKTQCTASLARTPDASSRRLEIERKSLTIKYLCQRYLLFAAAILLPVGMVRGGEATMIESPALLLKAAGIFAKTSPDQAAAWTEAGIRSALIVRFGRLLPDALPADDRTQLATLLQDSSAEAGDALEKAVASFPLAEDLVFDGQRYAGANLRFIDSMLGKSGRPIAFDRTLPELLVPLTTEAEAALTEKRAQFQSAEEGRPLREAAAKVHGEAGAATLFADGQFLRSYTGRFDDLYFHLFQNGNGASALAFGALTDGLGARTYRPVNGICGKVAVPAPGFDLNDILSDGGKSAVARYLQTAGPGRAGEPFKGFAFRVLPSLIGKVRTLASGDRFTASHPEILRALRSREHFYPIQVPPLYRSPDRFLGWAGSLFIPVAAVNPPLPPGAADSWYPLPQGAGRAPADVAADGNASAQLFESSSTPGLVWEDPQLSNLLADPETKTPPSGPASENRATPPNDPRLHGPSGRFIAVITPTAEEAARYLAAIADNDETLRAIEQARGTARLLRQFIASVGPAEGNGSSETADVQRAIAADLASLDRRQTVLDQRLQKALTERASVRTELEKTLTLDRVLPLQTLGKKAPEAENDGGRLSL